MRKAQKKQLLEIIDTFREAHKIVKKYIDDKNPEAANALLIDCQQNVIDIIGFIGDSEGKDCVTVRKLEEYCEVLRHITENVYGDIDVKNPAKVLDEALNKAANSVIQDITTRLEIVFVPYKASMWDSFDSIWRAANEDPNCDVYVVVSPYYSRNPDHSFGLYHYEGGDFPDYVPVVHYDTYDFEQRQPDIIYIHNPYDQYNYVTSVDPRFYSHELKKHTEMLVYVPYHLSGLFDGFHTAVNNIPSAFLHVDKIVVQTEILKEYYAYGGIPNEKIIALGSPKIDYVINEMQSVDIPDSWEEKAEGKTVILLNTSISWFLTNPNWMSDMHEMLRIFEEDSTGLLIWRPHPLLKETVVSMRPNLLNEYIQIEEKVNRCENIIIDNNASAYPAMKISDAMISDLSSLVMQFSFTGKPALFTDISKARKDTDIYCVDFFLQYFMADGDELGDFVSMVKNGCDERRDERLKNLAASVANPDGSCGQKINSHIINLVLR